MAFIREKTKKNQKYYYIVESVRTGGKVKQRILEYIGPLSKLKELALKGYLTDNHRQPENGSPCANNEITPDLSFKCYEHGSVMGMYQMARMIGIEEILDEAFPQKQIRGIKRSRILLLAMIHRAVDPGSKRAFASWAAATSLPYHLDFKAEDLTSQAFWEAMDGISEEDIKKAQDLITKKLIEMYPKELKDFHLDFTNYFTFIDSKNQRCVICKRGHNKQKRNDLRQFSLAMLTSGSLQVPFVWEMYEGNKNDKLELPDFMDLVKKTLPGLGISLNDITITFDGGGNSEETLSGLGVPFICAHSMAGHKELYDIALDNYEEVILENGKKRIAYRMDDFEFSGVKGTGILTYSEDLEKGQLSQLERDMDAISEKYNEVLEAMKNPKSKIYSDLKKAKSDIELLIRDITRTNEEIEKENAGKKGKLKKKKKIPEWDEEKALADIIKKKVIKKPYLAKFVEITASKAGDGAYALSLEVDNAAKQQYCKKHFGKKLTCTTRTEWTTEEILKEYLDQECIENGIFRVSKDTDHFSIRPQYHWTDEKIRVHVFCCLAAITIAEALRLKMEDADIKTSKEEMLDRLSEIHEGWFFGSGNKVQRAIESVDGIHRELWDVVMKIADSVQEKSQDES